VPTVASPAEQDQVRALQRALYRAAKVDPRRRFHALHDKVHRRDVLERAWGQVRANQGAPGIDRVSIAQIERHGVPELLAELAADLKEGRYRPLPARRVFIPKPGRPGEERPLSIPAVRDRIVQAAAKIVIEPIFEADFLPSSFGFRPRKAAHDALQVLLDESWRGRRWAVETDIASCFEAIPHEGLMATIRERIADRQVLKLLRTLLRAGVMDDGVVRRPVAGTPQGGVISPLLANVYLHRLDRVWQEAGAGVLCRYADDLVVMCQSEREAQCALRALRATLAELGLEAKAAKTRVVHLRVGGEGLDFLGFDHRLVRGDTRRSRHLTFLARWPSAPAMAHARHKLREITARTRLRVPVEGVVQELNRFLLGWAEYFRYGNSTRHFTAIRRFAAERLALFLAKRHKRSWAFGRRLLYVGSPDCLGLISLDGRVVAPRPNRPWRERAECRR
jgi:RNA-directed DNA polymerase